MVNIKTYKIEMSLSGRLTQLPDSQKIMGALIYMYAEQNSAQAASDFTAKIRENQLYFALSNMLPIGYLPMPHNYLLSKLPKNKSSKKNYKAIKKRQYVKAEQIFDIMNNPVVACEAFPYIYTLPSQQIHAAIDSIRYDLPGLDPNLYSVPEITVLEVKDKDDEKHEPVHKFNFFIAADDCPATEALINAIKEAQRSKKNLFLGPRASQGLNIYTIDRISPTEVYNLKTDFYLNLGMLLPRDINYAASYLQLFSSERRPYAHLGGWDQTRPNEFISYVEAGSIIFPDDGLKNIGSCIRSPFNPGRDIVFGNAFQFPINAVEGVRNEYSS